MTYKALMLDVDGTTIPYDYAALPSDAVAQAIKKAREQLTVCLVTGRSFGSIGQVLEKVGMDSGYAVVNNGAQVIDIETREFLYDQHISVEDAKEIADYLLKRNIPFYVKQDTFEDIQAGEFFSPDETLTTPYMIFTDEQFTEDEVDQIFKDFSHLPNLTLHKGLHKVAGKFSFNICHVNASKLHGIAIVMEKLGIQKDEIIGVGDSYNDFPLMMASGLKVAMGNAVPELKEIADIIAPTVTDDGVAWVIGEYVLGSG